MQGFNVVKQSAIVTVTSPQTSALVRNIKNNINQMTSIAVYFENIGSSKAIDLLEFRKSLLW